MPGAGLGPEGDLFAGRLKRRREELGFSQHKLAKAVGLSRNSIQKFEAGTLPRGDNLMALCRVLGVSADWLLGMDEPAYPPLRVSEESASFMEPDRLTPMAGPGPGDLEPPDPGQYAFVPLAEARLGAGGGDWVLSEETARLLAFRKDWLHGYATARENLVLMTVRGESMEPTIGDGDMVNDRRGPATGPRRARSTPSASAKPYRSSVWNCWPRAACASSATTGMNTLPTKCTSKTCASWAG